MEFQRMEVTTQSPPRASASQRLVARGTVASWRIASVPGPERERQLRVDRSRKPVDDKCQLQTVAIRNLPFRFRPDLRIQRGG
jgi:hypothetical protein